MKGINRSDKEKLWQSRVEMAAQFSGSNREFCQSQGIPIHTFQYWKAKLNKRTHTIEKQSTSPFIKVEIEEPAGHLPDPRWLADLIFRLGRDRR